MILTLFTMILVEQPPQVKPHTPGEQILMVDTSNLSHQEYQSNQEIKVNKIGQIVWSVWIRIMQIVLKALTNELIQTIRDIITLNPLYRWKKY